MKGARQANIGQSESICPTRQHKNYSRLAVPPTGTKTAEKPGPPPSPGRLRFQKFCPAACKRFAPTERADPRSSRQPGGEKPVSQILRAARAHKQGAPSNYPAAASEKT